MNTSKVTIPDFKEKLFPFGYFCELVGVKPNTIRTWLKRYFPEVGVKKENGKMAKSLIQKMVNSTIAKSGWKTAN